MSLGEDNEKEIINEGVWNLEQLEDKVMKSSQWISVGSKAYKTVGRTHQGLPAAVYTVTIDKNDGNSIFIKKDMKYDDLFVFNDSLTDKTLQEIETFWNSGKKFKDAGFLHRRGYLLYGPQGTGKTSIVQQVMRGIVNSGGIVLICQNPVFLNKGLATLRETEPDRQIVCVFEDIDAIIREYGEDGVLGLLDGANMVDRVINIATTNYPERLEKRIVSRPRRFDRVIKIGNPSDEIRKEFIDKKLPKKANRKVWYEKTEGLSFAAIAEAIISVYCLGNGFDETIAILRTMSEDQPSSADFDGKSAIGFTGDFGNNTNNKD